MKTKFLPIFALFAFGSTLQAQILLTGYGSSGSQPYTSNFTSGSVTVNTSNTLFTGSGEGIIARGSFSNVNVSSLGNPPVQLSLSLTFNATYSGVLSLQIGSGPGTAWGYTNTVSSLSGVQTLIFNRDVLGDAGIVNGTTINRVILTAENPNLTLDELSVVNPIPEPSSVLLLGLGGAGLALLHYRRKSA